MEELKEKLCYRCEIIKDIKDFPKNKKGDYRYVCKKCRRDFEMNEKICYKCDVLKDTKDFPKNKSKTDGYSYKCKSCRHDFYIKYKNKTHEKVKCEICEKMLVKTYINYHILKMHPPIKVSLNPYDDKNIKAYENL